MALQRLSAALVKFKDTTVDKFLSTFVDSYKTTLDYTKATYITPDMTNAQIQERLESGGTIHVQEGNYIITDTLVIHPNTDLYCSSGATFIAGKDAMVVMTCDPEHSGGNGVRNVRLNYVRIDISNHTGCIGFKGVKFRNHGHLNMMWVNMGTAVNNTGIELGTLCYGLKVDGCECIGGGTGSVRLLLRNGANAIVITGFNGYSGSPEVDMPNYGIIVRHGLQGETNWDYITTFPTEAVVFVGGYSQNTHQYGLLDQAQGTKVYGMYFENNSVADVRCSGAKEGSFSNCTHSSPTGGKPAKGYSVSSSTGILIDEPVYGSRAGGFFDIGGGSDAGVTNHVVNINRWNAAQGATKQDIGDLSAAKVNRDAVLQLTENTLDVNMGYKWYRRNVTSGINITLTGTPYDGMEINLMLRGNNIESLTIGGVPVDVTHANTAQIKMAHCKLVYSKPVRAWVINTGEWNATS